MSPAETYERMSRQFLGSPPGLTFCGLIGLFAALEEKDTQ